MQIQSVNTSVPQTGENLKKLSTGVQNMQKSVQGKPAGSIQKLVNIKV